MPSIKSHIVPEINARFVIIQEDVLQIDQYEMADICGITQPHVSRIRAGKSEVSTWIIKNLYINEGISPSYLIAGVLPKKLTKQIRTINQEVEALRLELELLRAELHALTKRDKKACY